VVQVIIDANVNATARSHRMSTFKAYL